MTTLPPSLTQTYQRLAHAKSAKPRVAPGFCSEAGAGKGARTLDLNLGKVALYQLSYSRKRGAIFSARTLTVKEPQLRFNSGQAARM